MAPRTSALTLNEKWRNSIATTMLIKRLQAHALSEADPQSGKIVELTRTQIKAAEILLNKTMPNLQAIQGNLGVTISHEQSLQELE